MNGTLALLAASLLGLAPRPQEGEPLLPPERARTPLSELRPGAALQPGATPVPLPEEITELELALDDCVRQVLKRNLALRIAELNHATDEWAVTAELGAFDPELYATVIGGDAETPTASTFQAPKNQNLTASTGLRGLYRTGLVYDLNYGLDYNRQSPTNPFFDFNPSLSSDLGVNLTQPLLRGFGSSVVEQPVEQARLLVARGDFELYQLVQNTAFEAVQAYWTLVRTIRERDTARNALEVAEELVRNNQRRLEAGVMTRLDVLTAQAESARRKENLIRAENAIGRAEDALKFLLSPGSNPRDWEATIVPVTPAELREETLPPEDEAILAAFTERPDLRALEVDLRIADLGLLAAENQSLPLFNLLGSYGYGGLAGQRTGGSDRSNLDLWGDSLEAIRDRDFLAWSVGFEFSRPLGNRTAHAIEQQARIQKERSYMLWLERRMRIVQEVRTALRDVADARAATEAAAQARVLADEQYQAELVRLENQHSTTFQVREAQRDLFEAQDRETTAITQYESLLAALERARGRLAQSYGVTWEPDPRPEGALSD